MSDVGGAETEAVRKKVVDSLVDIYNYAAIAYFWLEQENFLGE